MNIADLFGSHCPTSPCNKNNKTVSGLNIIPTLVIRLVNATYLMLYRGKLSNEWNYNTIAPTDKKSVICGSGYNLYSFASPLKYM